MRKNIALIIFSTIAIACNASPHEPSFKEFRKELINNGWTPFTFEQREYNDFPVTGEETELFEERIYEVESCSMDGGVLCILWYIKKGGCLTLTTRGEDLNNMRVITRQKASCPKQTKR